MRAEQRRPRPLKSEEDGQPVTIRFYSSHNVSKHISRVIFSPFFSENVVLYDYDRAYAKEQSGGSNHRTAQAT